MTDDVQVASALRRLEHTLQDGSNYLSVAEALREAVAGVPVVFRWSGEHGADFRGGVPREAEHFLETPWMRSADRYEKRLYDPTVRDPTANRVVSYRSLRYRSPEATDYFHERFMRPARLKDQLRVLLYDGSRLIAFVGLFRREGEPSFDREDAARLEALKRPIRDILVARQVLRQPGGALADVARVCERLHEPCFILGPSNVAVFANRVARLCYERPPSWLSRIRGSSLPAFARSVPVGPPDEPYRLVLIDPLAFGPREAACSPLARRFGLPPRLARVACLLVGGASEKEASVALELSWTTVRTYVQQLYARLQVQSRAELVHAAVRSISLR